MSDVPRQTLRDLIARHGPDLCGDARRCEALLRDLCGGHRREINILVGALRDRVPLDLLAARRSMPRDLLLARLAKRLEDHLALTADAARWAVESWALALGVVTDAELEESRRSAVESAQPQPQPTTKSIVEDDAGSARPASRAGTPTPAPQPQRPTAPAPPTATPSPRTTVNPPPRSNPSQAGGPAVAAPRTPSAPLPHAPPAPRAPRTGGLQTPRQEPAAPRGRRWRGCLIGCALLLLLSALLFVGAPFVFNVLREEQQQRNLEPPPAQSQ